MWNIERSIDFSKGHTLIDGAIKYFKGTMSFHKIKLKLKK